MDPKQLPPAILLALGLVSVTQEGCSMSNPSLSFAADEEGQLGPCLSPSMDADPEMDVDMDTDTDTGSEKLPPCLDIVPIEPPVGPCLEPPTTPPPPIEILGPCLSPAMDEPPPPSRKKRRSSLLITGDADSRQAAAERAEQSGLPADVLARIRRS